MLQDKKGRAITVREGDERIVLSVLLNNAPWWVQYVTLAYGEPASNTRLLNELMAGGEIEVDADEIGVLALTRDMLGDAMVEWTLENREDVVNSLEGDSVELSFDGVTPEVANEILQLALFSDIIYGEEAG